MKKIRTLTEVKINLHHWAEKQEDFTTNDAADEIRRKVDDIIRMGNHRVAQFLRGNKTHEFNKAIKKWVRIRV